MGENSYGFVLSFRYSGIPAKRRGDGMKKRPEIRATCLPFVHPCVIEYSRNSKIGRNEHRKASFYHEADNLFGIIAGLLVAANIVPGLLAVLPCIVSAAAIGFSEELCSRNFVIENTMQSYKNKKIRKLRELR